jgi:hypothetical protein|tara:strand:+ start:333 stop:1205 length:873 start_codon:yes stop_codon:yes gene_type:complete
MKNIVISLFLVCNFNIAYSQNNATIPVEENSTNTPLKEGSKALGVAVSPSSMRFNVEPGKTQTKFLHITNDTDKSYSFKISFANVNMGTGGDITPNEESNYEFGLKNWISAAPNFVELGPFEKAKVEITIKVPEGDINNRAAWCMGMVDQVTERKTIQSPDNESISLGVVPSFGFGVYFYQNPPNLKVSDVEILDFTFTYDDNNKYISLIAKNNGRGISRAKVYVELNELGSGFYEKLDLKVFNVLPGRKREFNFQLPGSMPKGRYSIMGVLDFGSDEEIKAASKEIIIQ